MVAIAGCALGLVRAASIRSSPHQPVSPCRLVHPAGLCVGHTLAVTVRPYVANAVGGLIAGALLAICFMLARNLATRTAHPLSLVSALGPAARIVARTQICIRRRFRPRQQRDDQELSREQVAPMANETAPPSATD